MLQDFRQKVIIIFFLGKSDVALSVYGNFSKIVLKDINNVRRISGWFLVNCGGGEKTMVRVIQKDCFLYSSKCIYRSLILS